jgi:hypothetical protein
MTSITIYCDGPNRHNEHPRYGLDAYSRMELEDGTHTWAPLHSAVLDGRDFIIKRGGLQHLAADDPHPVSGATISDLVHWQTERTRSRYGFRCRKCRFDVPDKDPDEVHRVFDKWTDTGQTEISLMLLKLALHGDV